MGGNKSIRWIVGLLLLGLILLLIFQAGDKRFSWRENFKVDSKEPYGLYAFYQLLEHYSGFGEVQVLRDSLNGQLPDREAGTGVTDGTYLFVGPGMYMRPQDRDALLAFVSDGNTALISCKVLPYDLMFYLYYTECEGYYAWDGLAHIVDSTITTRLYPHATDGGTQASFTFVEDFKGKVTEWNYFPEYYLCEGEQALQPIGYFAGDSLVNMVRIDYGDGTFYLHSQPRVFTNLFIVQPDGRRYAEEVLNLAGNGPLYWDQYSRIPERMARNQNNNLPRGPQHRLQSDSPLTYVLEQPPLAWAWYLLVATGLIYLIFRTRRRQRVVPVLPKRQNASLQLVQTLGFLYYQKSTHLQVARQAIQLLRKHVRQRYGLQWKNDDPAFLEQLKHHTNLPESLLAQIMADVANFDKRPGISADELINFHRRLEQFYQVAN
ncbi:MAG: DUF4350 domain-containing protein [Bacteroidetes bacterium]|nr:MAG: DUF4350 domain-containing protein [Bacteroidota bacterium]